jgi:hypothetical protein
MAKQFPALTPEHIGFIRRQRVFFTGSAAQEGRVNVSPKGLDTLRVLDPHTVVYLDLTGSGNETAAHVRAAGRLTLMFCAFEGPPMILRLYGTGRILPRGGEAYARLLAAELGGVEPVGARQMVALDIDLVQTSCGYGVPHMTFAGERPSLENWANAKGEDGLRAYRAAKNRESLDGYPTGFAEPEDATSPSSGDRAKLPS